MLEGGCHCGAVRYRTDGKVEHHALCHCLDCRKSAG
ncbi:MAG TPA: aldehyde-activating protein, partial [Brevundimonas sp.]|nr:aldehyde-activating protein [Brevundimonas sp.]HAV49921.1 aldehyde-activating protein [Brevundimonas sp.]